MRTRKCRDQIDGPEINTQKACPVLKQLLTAILLVGLVRLLEVHDAVWPRLLRNGAARPLCAFLVERTVRFDGVVERVTLLVGAEWLSGRLWPASQ